MDINAVGIPLTFVVLSAIGLWMIIFSKGSWMLKMAFIAVCLYFSILMWRSLSDLSGWASSSPVPQKSMVHWILVQEPSKTNKSEAGAIFIWCTEIDLDNNPINKSVSTLLKPFSARKNNVEPRAYRMPYSEQAHQQAARAMQFIMNGKPVVAERMGDGSGSGSGEAEGMNQGDGKGATGNGHGGMSQEQVFRFYELPPSKLPSKVTGKE